MSVIDQVAEQLSEWFGSVPFIVIHIALIVTWYFANFDEQRLISLLSIEAIFLSLFILRAENIQSKRTEKDVKADKRMTREILKKVGEK